MADEINWNEFFDGVVSSVSKNGLPLLKIQQLEERYGVPRYLSMGYPNLDLHLMNRDDEWGLPYGRVIGTFGAQSAWKTWFMLECAAENLRIGGHSYLLTCEVDIDKEHMRYFLKKRAIKEDFSELNYAGSPIDTIADMEDQVEAILEPYEEIADKLEKQNKNPQEELPPIFIGVDSLGALMAQGDKDRKDDGDNLQMGRWAKEIHEFFQVSLRRFARLGVMFYYTNHYRDNMGFGRKKYKPAHNSALKYYPSIRLEFKEGYERKHNQERKSQKLPYKKGRIMEIVAYKTRNSMTQSGSTELKFYENKGFDKAKSIIDAACMAGVVSLYRSYYVIDEDDEKFSDWAGKYKFKELKELVIDNVELRVKMARACYKRGPMVLQSEEVLDEDFSHV